MRTVICLILSLCLAGCARQEYRPQDFGAGKNLHVYSVSGVELGVFATGSFANCEKIAETWDRDWFDMGESGGQRIICSNDPPKAYMNWAVWFGDESGAYAIFLPNEFRCGLVQKSILRAKLQILNPCMPAKESLKYHSVVMAPVLDQTMRELGSA